MSVVPTYLERAEEHGLLHVLNGVEWVGGTVDNPTTGTRDFLIEWIDHAAPPGQADDIACHVVRSEPGFDRLLLRSAPDHRPRTRWRPLITYLVLADAVLDAGDPPLEIRVASTDSDRRQVARWLVQAVLAADPAAERALAEAYAVELLRDGDVRSWIAYEEGRPAGHATARRSVEDGPSVRILCELIDTLSVRPGRGTADALARRASTWASAQGQPLWGHVVHRPENGPREARLLADLEGRGWVRDLVYLQYVGADVGRTQRGRVTPPRPRGTPAPL